MGQSRSAAVKRAARLRELGLADNLPEEPFDRLTWLACRLLAAPTALVSLLDADHQHFKGAYGLPRPWATRRTTPLSHSFCRHVVEGDGPFVVENACEHSLVRDNPAISELGVAAYLGVPVRTPDGLAVGALCVIDAAPRRWRAEDLVTLDHLARAATTELELRQMVAKREGGLRRAKGRAARYRAIVQDQTELICRYRADTTLTFVNDAYARYFGRPKRELVGRPFLDLIPPASHGPMLEGIAALQPDRPVTHEHEVLRADGTVGWQEWTNRAITDTRRRIVEYQAVGRDITERRRLELELKTITGRLDRALAAMMDGFALYDADDRLLLCNDRLRELYPLARDLLIPGARMRGVWREAARRGQYRGVTEAGFDDWLDARRRNASTDGCEEVELGNGGWRQIKASRMEDGGTVIVVRDVSERKRSEEALTQAHAQLAASAALTAGVLDAQTELVCRFRPDTTLLYVNDAYARTFGGTKEALIGRRFLDFIPAQEHAPVLAQIAQLTPANPSQKYEIHAVLPGGRTICTEWIDHAVFDAVGKLVEYQSVGRDVTERKRLEQELERVQQRLTDAIESLPDGFALFDAGERLVMCNTSYVGFFPAIANILIPGARFEDLVRASVQQGCIEGVAVEEANSFAARRAAEHRAPGARYEVALSDGRRLQTIARRTREGGIVGIRRDVTELRRAQQALEHAASHDPLTDLANRATFRRALEHAWTRAERSRHRFAVMLIDLDRFKEINDGPGHAVGDMLLVEVAARLRAALRDGDLAARLGGDEFAVLAEGRDTAEFVALAARLVERLGTPARFDEIEVRPGASLGFTVYPDDKAGPSELLVHADRALYAAKEAGRGTWAGYAPAMEPADVGSASPKDEITVALERGEFELHYQPIVALEGFEVVGVEALLRWRHPARGLLPAGSFIGAAERRPLILELTRHVLAQALRQQRAWVEAKTADMRLWVNLAPRCLAWEGLVDAVAAELAAAGVPAERLVLEITEGAFANLEAAETRVNGLRLLGASVAVDDFGAGYSSLARLRALHINAVKIDRAFVVDVARAARDRAIVRTIVALGGNLGLTPLAEGIETGEQLRVLRKLGCVWGQGYLFARPMPPGQLEPWLATWNERRRLDPDHDLLRRREGAD